MYLLDLEADPVGGVSLDIELLDKVTGLPVRTGSTEHQLILEDGWGGWCGCCGAVASNSNGMITSPQDGYVRIAVPASVFGPCPWRRWSTRFRLTAAPMSGVGAPATIAAGTISFGG